MRIQILVATMNLKDSSLVKKMNIKSDVIIGNQCDHNSVEDFIEDNVHVKVLNFAERGVGLNRNNALMRADGEICLFADDDMIYEDNYLEIVENAFNCNPQADVIVFNLRENPITRKIIKKKENVGYFNYLRYGTARVAVRLSSVRSKGIYFNQCFGGGTEHCHGEDNLFLHACLREGLKVIAIPEYIATLTEERESSWNKGFNKKYIKDQGVLFKTISRRWWKLLCFQDVFRRHKSYNLSIIEAYRLMINDAKK